MGSMRRTVTGVLVAGLLSACGGGSSAPPFKAASAPPADVCSLLTIDEVQTLLPGARAGVAQQTQDTSHLEFWLRECKWDLNDTSAQAVDFVINGAMTPGGLAGIK